MSCQNCGRRFRLVELDGIPNEETICPDCWQALGQDNQLRLNWKNWVTIVIMAGVFSWSAYIIYSVIKALAERQ